MKLVDLKILNYQEDNFFKPIRDKIDYIRVLMYSSRTLLLDYTPETTPTYKIRLIINKSNRLYFYQKDKYYSISFPFIVSMNEGKVLSIRTYSGKNIDNQSISAVLSIIDDKQFQLKPSLIDLDCEPNSITSIGIPILEELILSEPSYIRYDNDPGNYNGKVHPIDHFDINYSNYGTFKIGLNSRIDESFFEDTLEIMTDCKFIDH